MGTPAKAILAFLYFFSCCANASAVSYDYDPSVPLELRVARTHTSGGGDMADVSYGSGDGIVRATLVWPERAAQPMPGVLFVHWLGEPATTNRTEFLADATWLARRGIVSLLPDQPWAQPHWFEKIRSTATDAADSRAEVISLRRSLDALLATPGIDPARVAYVGLPRYTSLTRGSRRDLCATRRFRYTGVARSRNPSRDLTAVRVARRIRAERQSARIRRGRSG